MNNLISEHKEFDKKREATFKENQRLIAYWDSIPWWQFWKKPSFEVQRDIIISNWDKLK